MLRRFRWPTLAGEAPVLDDPEKMAAAFREGVNYCRGCHYFWDEDTPHPGPKGCANFDPVILQAGADIPFSMITEDGSSILTFKPDAIEYALEISRLLGVQCIIETGE
jgi:hypothetical protein